MVSSRSEEERNRAPRDDFLAGEVIPSFQMTNACLWHHKFMLGAFNA
jgi:hypothetical protein